MESNSRPFCSYPLGGVSPSKTEIQQYSMEENEGSPYSTKANRRCHHHKPDYDGPESLAPLQSAHKLRASAHCMQEELAEERLKRKELETAVAATPWPSLHINIDNKAEEKPLSEKSLHSPALPTSLKCNILKAQMDSAFRVKNDRDSRSSSSGPEPNGRFPTSSLDSVSSSMTTEKASTRSERRKRLVRQYSFDEDDLPASLAAISSKSSTGKTASECSLDSQVQPPIYSKADFALLKIGMEYCHRSPSPTKPPPFFPESVPQLVSCDTKHKDSGDSLRMDVDREKLLRRLLMTEL